MSVGGPRLVREPHPAPAFSPGTGSGAAWASRWSTRGVEHARSLGLEQPLLSVRGTAFLPGYYTARGWTEVGRRRDAVGRRRDARRTGPDDG